jgi:hypothetical protein
MYTFLDIHQGIKCLCCHKVIMATNRADTLDPALLRPGRLDRKIEFPLPARREKRLIFQTITSKMNLGPDVDLEDCEFAINPYHLLSPLILLLQTCQDLIDCLLQKSHRLSKVLASKVCLPCIFFFVYATLNISSSCPQESLRDITGRL